MWAKATEALAAVEMEEAMAWRRAVGRVGGGRQVKREGGRDWGGVVRRVTRVLGECRVVSVGP